MKYCKTARLSLCLLGLLTLFIPSGLALATGSDGGFEQEVDGFRFKLVFAEHPQTGPNEVGIEITDPSGSPVLGALVEATPAQVAEDHTTGEAEAEQPEAVDGGHMESMGESAADHGETLPQEDHGEMESHEEMEAGGHEEIVSPEEGGEHEEAGGHGESKSVLLKASEEVGHYSGKISFTQPGDWSVSVRVALPEGAAEKELHFPIDVIDAGPPWGVLSSFFGVNLAVVAVAGILKRKSSLENHSTKGRA